MTMVLLQKSWSILSCFFKKSTLLPSAVYNSSPKIYETTSRNVSHTGLLFMRSQPLCALSGPAASQGLSNPTTCFSCATAGPVDSKRFVHIKSRVTSVHRKDAVTVSEGDRKYEPQSPYREHWPRRYGYFNTLHRGGLLPRIDARIGTLPHFKVRKKWDKKHALFGQNDYIDILGDGTVSPIDLITGPAWLRGFKGNELQRLQRQLKHKGEKIRILEPTKFHNIKKRMFYLHKKYNVKRYYR